MVSISTLEIGQTCEKCNKVVWGEADPDAAMLMFSTETNVVEKGLSKLMEEHQIHLCPKCEYDFAVCSAKEITFGECVGNDNVLKCDKYKVGG